MSEGTSETPRLSRREMRERGLLKPVSEGIASAERLSRTQELKLRRPSRKEMREREAAQRQQAEAVEASTADDVATSPARADEKTESVTSTAPVSQDESAWRPRPLPTQATEPSRSGGDPFAAADRKSPGQKTSEQIEEVAAHDPVQPAEETGRRSVFDRFSSDEGASFDSLPAVEEKIADTGEMSQPAVSPFAPPGRWAAAAAISTAPSADEAPLPEDDDWDDEDPRSLQERLLERVQQEGRTAGDIHAAEAATDGRESDAASGRDRASDHAKGDDTDLDVPATGSSSGPHTGETAGASGVPQAPAAVLEQAKLAYNPPGASSASDAKSYGAPSSYRYVGEDSDFDDEDERPRGWLIVAIFILGGLVVGLLLGWLYHYLRGAGDSLIINDAVTYAGAVFRAPASLVSAFCGL
ncbi:MULTISPECIES: hypothetical protein [unclassified Actinobaculum]|uniref:hypothetical protein n=1 Tax=unclassified Actinobaculum TaxID=2609299 RepID=UPI000D5273F4|nr:MULTISPECIES: hypothetical protein [unclassified Actinobaculum]AWE42231.1 hypothetical protein DDD63_05105 [Actinobaculum sp. 313]RTE50796.1 hypothetical protein EKN07_01255 [Actinobaculum sp. 352]